MRIEESTLNRLSLEILQAGAMVIRNVPKNVTNEQVESLPPTKRPFLYASGNWGPGYVSIKGLVGQQKLMTMLCKYLAFELAERWPDGIDFVAGNVTGGVVPGWIVSNELSELLGKVIPFVYIRDLRKTGGHKELITGIENNPEIFGGHQALNVEELVNFAQTICNGVNCLREEGFEATKGACVLYYNNPEAKRDLDAAGIKMTYLLTLPKLIDVAEESGMYPKQLTHSYREFLEDPLKWQADRGLVRVERGGTK